MGSDYDCPTCGPLTDTEYPTHSDADCVRTLQAECQRLREALASIESYEPERRPYPPPAEDCAGCKAARANKWPPSGLCNNHYCERDDVSRWNERRMNGQWMSMKDIARRALLSKEDSDGEA